MWGRERAKKLSHIHPTMMKLGTVISCLKKTGIVGMTLTFYNRVAKGLKLKVRRFWGLSPTFVEVTG